VATSSKKLVAKETFEFAFMLTDPYAGPADHEFEVVNAARDGIDNSAMSTFLKRRAIIVDRSLFGVPFPFPRCFHVGIPKHSPKSAANHLDLGSKRGATIANPGAVKPGRMHLYWRYMSAQIQTTNAIQVLASDVADKDIPDWLLLPGLLLSVSGIILLVLGNWTPLNTVTKSLLLLCGALFCFVGVILIPSWLIYRTKEVSDRQTIGRDRSS